MKKAIAVLVVLAALGLVGWKVYRKVTTKGGNHRRQSRALAVEVGAVKKMPMRNLATFTGSLFARYKFIVSPKVPGRLKRLLVDVGDPVERGQLIATLEAEEYGRELEQARAGLLVAKANVRERQSSFEAAKREFDRVSALFKRNIASESEMDAKQSAFRVAEAQCSVAIAQVAHQEAALKAAEVRLSYTRIRAEWEAGDKKRVVGERFVDEGGMLKANEPIVSILDINLLEAVIHVIERDYRHVHVGQEAVITTDAFPDRRFTGRVTRVAPLLKETSRQAQIEIEIANRDLLLKPGMFVRVEIELDRRDDATVVPVGALCRRNGKQGVFVAYAGERKARFVPLKIGIVDQTWAEVAAPRLSGWVVTLGQHLLGDNSDISVPGRASGPWAPRKPAAASPKTPGPRKGARP